MDTVQKSSILATYLLRPIAQIPWYVAGAVLGVWFGVSVGISHLLAAERATVAEPSTADSKTTNSTSAVSFELDVQPILTAAGCNAGACHGKQRGQNGFQLSLLGFDSNFDHDAITRQARGRRIFPAAPQQSLLLRKATAEIPHGGGVKIQPNSADYQTLVRWIAAGAPRAIEGEPRLVSVRLAESSFSLEVDQSIRLQTTATYSDGSTRDVTRLTTYLSNDSSVAKVDESGIVTAGALPGETAIMARYMNHICVADVVIPQSERMAAEYYAKLPRKNFIDDLVYQKLSKTGVKLSEPVSDATFMRRVYQDLIGRLPSVEEAREFLDTQSKNKRKYLVERLLQRPEYADHWANYWADLLRPNPYRVGIKAVLNYDNWIRQQFRRNVPYDEFVRQLVTARGSTWRNGAVTLYRDRRTPDEMATLVSQLFLGVRLECAKCHHHPFEKWSQRDFYQFAAYFAQVDHKGTGLSPPISGGEETIFISKRGSVKHPVTGESLSPKPLIEALPASARAEVKSDAARNARSNLVDPRAELVDWMLRDNPYFAHVQANRLWAALMGRGLVEPVDDLRSTNPPTNPQLLDALAEHFRESGFDQKELLKTICLSHVYSLSSTPTESNLSDRLNYSRHYRHRLRAEVLMDSVADVTETEHAMRGMPKGARANQVWTHRVDSMFLDTFGRPDENQDPPCERTSDSTVTQALHLMNSTQLDARIKSDEGRAARLTESDMTSQEIAEELYLAIFSRYPSDQEASYAARIIQQRKDQRQAIEDLMWAMINSPEFSIQN